MPLRVSRRVRKPGGSFARPAATSSWRAPSARRRGSTPLERSLDTSLAPACMLDNLVKIVGVAGDALDDIGLDVARRWRGAWNRHGRHRAKGLRRRRPKPSRPVTQVGERFALRRRRYQVSSPGERSSVIRMDSPQHRLHPRRTGRPRTDVGLDSPHYRLRTRRPARRRPGGVYQRRCLQLVQRADKPPCLLQGRWGGHGEVDRLPKIFSAASARALRLSGKTVIAFCTRPS